MDEVVHGFVWRGVALLVMRALRALVFHSSSTLPV